jgi:protein MpaA
MTMRNYAEISRRLEALSTAYLRVETAGVVEGYPVYHVALQGAAGASRILLLTAGVHGDEPAGVEAALRFLERDHAALLEHFHFMVVPCVNPTGYGSLI